MSDEEIYQKDEQVPKNIGDEEGMESSLQFLFILEDREGGTAVEEEKAWDEEKTGQGNSSGDDQRKEKGKMGEDGVLWMIDETDTAAVCQMGVEKDDAHG